MRPFCSGATLPDEHIQNALNQIDGLLLTGGDDFNPELYGEKAHPALGEVCDLRDAFELQLLCAAKERDLPVFGICRGAQAIGVAFGGRLWQDLPSQLPKCIEHRTTDAKTPVRHSLAVQRNTKLSHILERESIVVNSYHHQAIKDCPQGFAVSALSADGVIEAVEACSSWFCVGVQWHPERMLDCTDDAMSAKCLMQAFADVCRQYKHTF